MLWADAEPIADVIVAAEKPVMILYIGNDVSEGAADYVDDLAKADGEDYEITFINGGVIADMDLTAIENVLANDEWDYILVQEDIDTIVDGNGYVGFDALAEVLATEGAEVKIVDGWNYSEETAPDGDIDTMFGNVADADSAIENCPTVIETSLAIYYVGYEMDVWAANGKALNANGSYATSLVIYEAISGADITENTFAPADVDAQAIVAAIMSGR